MYLTLQCALFGRTSPKFMFSLFGVGSFQIFSMIFLLKKYYFYLIKIYRCNLILWLAFYVVLKKVSGFKFEELIFLQRCRASWRCGSALATTSR